MSGCVRNKSGYDALHAGVGWQRSSVLGSSVCRRMDLLGGTVVFPDMSLVRAAAHSSIAHTSFFAEVVFNLW